MKYCDLHCDALTASGAPQVTKARLISGGCLLQCFAAFVGEGGYARFLQLADAFDALCAREGYHKALCARDVREDSVNAVLTAEGGAFATLGELRGLYARGVRMAGFVWNVPTAAAYPNFPDYAGLCAGRVPFSLREKARGLTAFGHEAAEEMARLGIIPDLAHASDRAFWEMAEKKRPFAVSHTGAACVQNAARNLTDAQLAALGDRGGVAGLYVCADFLSEDGGDEGQRAALAAHARAILRAGGEDVLAIGSDFDGIPPNPFLPHPAKMPLLLQLLADEFGARIAEKAARDNVLRLFSDVCG